MNLLSVILWIPAITLKIMLAIIGLVVVPFTKPDNVIYGNNEHPTPPKWFRPEWSEWARDYWWRAIRNPVNNLRYFMDEPPIDELHGVQNCDVAVRTDGQTSAWRFVRGGKYSEFWYVKRVGDEFFEFRIGWKFSGVPGFGPTIQFRLGG